MIMIKYVKGDLLDLAEKGVFDVIVHGCNCFNNMGAGIAVAVKGTYLEAYKKDRESAYGKEHKLGKFTFANVTTKAGTPLTVINAYTQFEYGGGKINADYDAIRNVFSNLNVMYRHKKVGIPLIGAGLAGGDWKVIQDIILEETQDLDLTVVLFDKESLFKVLGAVNTEIFGEYPTEETIREYISKVNFAEETNETISISPLIIKELLDR